jgi:superfamily II DNA/RNA helicase
MENTPEDLEEVETNKYLNLNEGADSDDEEKMGQVVEEEMMQLKSKKTWDKLKIPVELEDRLIQLGFKQPSKIQATVIPIARKTSVFA